MQTGVLRKLAIASCVLTLVGTAQAQRKGKPVKCRFEYAYSTPEGSDHLDVTVSLPMEIQGRQKVVSLKCEPKATRIIEKGDNRYAEFVLEPVPEKGSIVITAELQLWAPKKGRPRGRPRLSEAARAACLQAEKHIDADDEKVVEAAADLRGKTSLLLAESAAKLVAKRLKYTGYEKESKGAAKALAEGGGDCSEFSDLMVSLLRARKMPARIATGYVTEWTDTPLHAWVEVWDRRRGWVFFDPTHGRNDRSKFEGREPIYIQTSGLRNDPLLNGHFFCSYNWRGKPVVVKSRFTVEVDGKTRSADT